MRCFLAEGKPAAARSDAERHKVVLLADARKQAQILKGEGDARRNEIHAKARSIDPDFFCFYRSMQAYEKAPKDDDTTLVPPPNSDFVRYFGHLRGEAPHSGG